MSMKTETIHRYTCDLCDKEVDEKQIWGVERPQQNPQAIRVANRRIDICADCLTRPISDLKAEFDLKEAGGIKVFVTPP